MNVVELWHVLAAAGDAGAEGGGGTAGKGARMKGYFDLTQGSVLKIVVGQMGIEEGSYSGSLGHAGGGGGGSFVIKSPYNTYLHKGLPPGPINSPGKKSLLAALYPEENDYLFFVAKGDGYHTFSKTERGHNRAKKKLQKLRRALKSNRII